MQPDWGEKKSQHTYHSDIELLWDASFLNKFLFIYYSFFIIIFIIFVLLCQH